MEGNRLAFSCFSVNIQEFTGLSLNKIELSGVLANEMQRFRYWKERASNINQLVLEVNIRSTGKIDLLPLNKDRV